MPHNDYVPGKNGLDILVELLEVIDRKHHRASAMRKLHFQFPFVLWEEKSHLCGHGASTKEYTIQSVAGIQRLAVISQQIHPDEERKLYSVVQFGVPLVSYPCSFIDVKSTIGI